MHRLMHNMMRDIGAKLNYAGHRLRGPGDAIRTTVNLDDGLLKDARRLARIEDNTKLVSAALKSLVALKAAR